MMTVVNTSSGSNSNGSSSSSNPESSMSNPSIPVDDPIIPTSPTWKLYHNPFFINLNCCSHHHHYPPHHKSPNYLQRSHSATWDLTFFKMEETNHNNVLELKAELDYERKLRKKAESLNKMLAREAAEERSGKEALERVCENLARKVSADAAEMDRMRREMEEERKMLRMAEVLREERVQMKLSDARIVWEEKLSEILRGGAEEKGIEEHEDAFGLGGKEVDEGAEGEKGKEGDSEGRGKCRKVIIGGVTDKWWWGDEVGSGGREKGVAGIGGNGTIENPHIRRGIKGFVEFRRVVRNRSSSNGHGHGHGHGHGGTKSSSSSSRHWGTKLEIQKAQLRILLKQRSPIRSSNNNTLIIR